MATAAAAATTTGEQGRKKKWAIINGRRNWTCKLVLMTSARLILIIGRQSRNNVQVRLSWLILLFTVVASLYCRLTSCTSDAWSCTTTPASDVAGRLKFPRTNTNTAPRSAVHEKPRFIAWHQHFSFLKTQASKWYLQLTVLVMVCFYREPLWGLEELLLWRKTIFNKSYSVLFMFQM